MTVTGPFGQAATVRPPLAADDSARRLDPGLGRLPGLFPDGPMNATRRRQAGLAPGDDPAAAVGAGATGSASLFAIPWSIIGLILLLVAIGVGIWYLLRWRRRLRRAELAAVAARARRDTERQPAWQGAAGNGHSATAPRPTATRPTATGTTPPAELTEAKAAQAETEAGPAEAKAASAEASAPGAAPDGGGTATEGTTE